MEGHALAMDRHQQLLLDTGRVLMMLAAVILTLLLGTTAAASNDAEFQPIALLLWLIGTALTVTSLVARQFLTLAAAGVCESPPRPTRQITHRCTRIPRVVSPYNHRPTISFQALCFNFPPASFVSQNNQMASLMTIVSLLSK
jgi:hypothetical protein